MLNYNFEIARTQVVAVRWLHKCCLEVLQFVNQIVFGITKNM